MAEHFVLEKGLVAGIRAYGVVTIDTYFIICKLFRELFGEVRRPFWFDLGVVNFRFPVLFKFNFWFSSLENNCHLQWRPECSLDR